jgi:hypothetical protein
MIGLLFFDWHKKKALPVFPEAPLLVPLTGEAPEIFVPGASLP